MADEHAALLGCMNGERIHKSGLPNPGFAGYESDPPFSRESIAEPFPDTSPLLLTTNDPAGTFRGTQGAVSFADWSNEAIPSPMHRFDEPRRTCLIAERPSEFSDRRRQHRLTDRGVRPCARQQVVFRDKLSRLTHKQLQHGERLVTQPDGLVAVPQPLVDNVEAKWPQ
jgi:hypothetical protein